MAPTQSTCAILSNGAIKCWGNNGDDELPSDIGTVSVVEGSDVWVTDLIGGGANTCAILSDGKAKCWGWNVVGMLGLGHTNDIGDDELPSSVGPIQFFQ